MMAQHATSKLLAYPIWGFIQPSLSLGQLLSYSFYATYPARQRSKVPVGIIVVDHNCTYPLY